MNDSQIPAYLERELDIKTILKYTRPAMCVMDGNFLYCDVIVEPDELGNSDILKQIRWETLICLDTIIYDPAIARWPHKGENPEWTFTGFSLLSTEDIWEATFQCNDWELARKRLS